MVIENGFRSPIMRWLKIFNGQPCGDWIFFCHTSLWQPKNFGCHKRGACHMFLESPPFLVIENIELPSNSRGMSNGDWKNLVNIQHIPTIRWQLKFFDRSRRHWGDDFFWNDITCVPFCLFQSPTRMGDLKKYGHHPTITIFRMAIEVF